MWFGPSGANSGLSIPLSWFPQNKCFLIKTFTLVCPINPLEFLHSATLNPTSHSLSTRICFLIFILRLFSLLCHKNYTNQFVIGPLTTIRKMVENVNIGQMMSSSFEPNMLIGLADGNLNATHIRNFFSTRIRSGMKRTKAEITEFYFSQWSQLSSFLAASSYP